MQDTKQSTEAKQASLPASHLARILDDAALFANKAGDIPLLNAIRLESSAKHLIAIATDRFTLGSSVANYHDDGGEEFAVSIKLADAQLITKVTKSVKSAFTDVTIAVGDNGMMTFTFTGGVVLTIPKLVEASGFPFPDWRKLIETAPADDVAPTKAIGVNPQYIAKFGRVTNSQRMVMKFNGPTRPAHVSVGAEFAGLIMPVRLDESEFEWKLPEWATRPEPKVEAAPATAAPRKRAPRKATKPAAKKAVA